MLPRIWCCSVQRLGLASRLQERNYSPKSRLPLKHCVFPFLFSEAFINLVNYLFSIPGAFSVSVCLKFLGCQRQRGGVNKNSTVKKSCQKLQALRVINTVSKDIQGNCSGNKAIATSGTSSASLNRRPSRRRSSWTKICDISWCLCFLIIFCITFFFILTAILSN